MLFEVLPQIALLLMHGDHAAQVVQFRARCDQRDLRRGITAPQFAD